MNVEIRDYRPEDFDAVKAIHDSTEIDYQFPDIAQPLFLVKKVLTVDGVVRQVAGAYVQAELYLWADPSDWATPEQKLLGIAAIESELMKGLWLQGVDCAVLWLPPGMERFGDRLEQLGFHKDRDGWVSYSKQTGVKQ